MWRSEELSHFPSHPKSAHWEPCKCDWCFCIQPRQLHVASRPLLSIQMMNRLDIAYSTIIPHPCWSIFCMYLHGWKGKGTQKQGVNLSVKLQEQRSSGVQQFPLNVDSSFWHGSYVILENFCYIYFKMIWIINAKCQPYTRLSTY